MNEMISKYIENPVDDKLNERLQKDGTFYIAFAMIGVLALTMVTWVCLNLLMTV